jgi:hypothetical protein
MTEIGWVKVVRCPELDMDVPICDCTGCEYYEGEDDNSESITCDYGGAL